MLTPEQTSQTAAGANNRPPAAASTPLPEATPQPVSPAAPEAAAPAASPQPAAARTPPPARWRVRAAVFGLLTGILLALLILLFAPVLREGLFTILPESQFALETRTMELAQLQREVQLADKRVASLQRRLEALVPRQPYLIVNSSGNRIYVMSGKKVLHQGICSTGSYVLLKAQDDRQWIFSTPRGMFRIQGKVKNPVWRMPDWAFIEEGRPVPPPNSPERFERGVLGDYALAFGNGYLIHGTLYQRLLGMPVTHGCVRLGDEDLRIVYQHLQLGSKVFIY